MDTATAGPIDVMRVICLVVGSFTVAATLVVMIAYVAALRRHRRQRQAGLVPQWRGLLLKHVLAIAASYTGLVLVTMYTVAINLRNDPTNRAFLYTILYAVGLWAMWEVLGYTRRREAVDAAAPRTEDPSPGQ